VPPWDFDAPEAAGNPRDSAAAAIVASALFDLARLHPDEDAATEYRRKCGWITRVLCTEYLAREGAQRGLLKHGCYSKPHNEGVDSATMFGDFYFTELLCKRLHEGRFRPPAAAVFA
jgi:unsaturated chondroitin disaccharide hydrolase